MTFDEKFPEFSPPVATTAKAGSVRFNSSYGVHAAIPFENKRKQRGYWTLSLCRGDSSEFTKLSNLWREREFSVPFWQKTTPRARALFGWPKPGHSYYTPETVESLAHWYPEMDLAPYQEAMEA